MIFTALTIFMTIAAFVAVVIPLFRRSYARVETFSSGQSAVYRDQLREIQYERDEGLINENAFDAARTEIARRLIAIENNSNENKKNMSFSSGRNFRWPVSILVLILCTFVGLTYPYLGSPGAADQPLAARLSARQPDLPILIARVEHHLAENPNDGRGWDVIAPIYLRQKRFDVAIAAYANAIRSSGPNAQRLVGMGESMVAEASGVVTDQALAIFLEAQTLQGDDVRSAYFIALADEQSGEYTEALHRFTALRKDIPKGAPLIDLVDRHIRINRNRLADQGVITHQVDKQTLDATAALSSIERSDMIKGMVAGLAEKLREDPDNLEDWMKLIRSYDVLGERGNALSALEDAISFYGESSVSGRKLRTFATVLDLAKDKP